MIELPNQFPETSQPFDILDIKNYKEVAPPHFNEKTAEILQKQELITALRAVRESTSKDYLSKLVNLGNLVDFENYNIDSKDTFWFKNLNSHNKSNAQTREKIIMLNQANLISLPELCYLLAPSCLEIQEIDGKITIPEDENKKVLTQDFIRNKIPSKNIRQAILIGKDVHQNDLIQMERNILYSQTSYSDKKTYNTYKNTMRLLELERGLYFYIKRLHLLSLWGATGLIYTDTSARPLQKITSLIWKQISDSPIPQQQFSNLHHESIDAKHFSEEVVKKVIKGWKKLGFKIGLIDERGSAQSTLKSLEIQLNKYLDEKPEIKKLGNAFFYLYHHPLFPPSVDSRGGGFITPREPLFSRTYNTAKNAKQQWSMAKKLIALLSKDSMERCSIPII